MTVEFMQTLSLAFYIIAFLLFLLSIALFFLLDVPRLYGEISGRAAKKAIEEIRRENSGTTGKVHASKPKKDRKFGAKKPSGPSVTARMNTEAAVRSRSDRADTAALSYEAPGTTVLDQPGPGTTVLGQPGPGTTVLDQPGPGTTVLDQPGPAEAAPISQPEPVTGVFSLDVEMTFTASKEIIE